MLEKALKNNFEKNSLLNEFKTLRKNSPLNLSQNIKFLEKYRTVDFSRDVLRTKTDWDRPNETPS